MYWYHKCHLEWMKARQLYLTATDIKDLLPVTKTGRKRTVTEEDYLKVWSRKQIILTGDDCISTGAAARGHLLEPYAIDLFNCMTCYNFMYHWDDKLITNGTLAFSPDALNINRDGQIIYDINSDLNGLNSLAEVKSYNIEQHMIKGCTDKMKLEERWQIATAMVVRPEIKTGYLLLYNPSCEYKMFIHEYKKSNLKNEIKVINEIVDSYKDFLNNNPIHNTESKLIYGLDKNELDIINELESSLNPV